MRSLAEAERHWHKLGQFHSLAELSAHVSSHEEPQMPPGLRSVCWKIFLIFKTLDRSLWLTSLAISRKVYESLRAHRLRTIRHPDEFDAATDPLSEAEKSPWVALRADEDLRAEIFQDVERCMPDNVYFRQPLTQDMMLDILFVWCKMHPAMGYRQGMHELLATVLWAVERDAVENIEVKANATNLTLTKILDSHYIEHDTYALFSVLMQSAETFYVSTGVDHSSQDTSILARSSRIFGDYLPKVDPELFAHLTKLGILPQIFLLRWIRLLFGREFPLDSVLQMWDIIFAIDSSLELVDFIAISLLLRIRWQLIAADTNEALTLLLKYPDPATPAHTFVKDALYLRDHLNPQGGADVISRYGKQAPVFEQEITLVASAMLPPQSPVLDTGRQDPSSPTRMISQSGQRIEALLQGAAKNVMEAGSSWVVGKALRAAVGEARRNVETFAAGPQPGQISSEFRNKQYRQQRQPVPKVGGSSPIIHGVEQEGATKQMETLKKRNNELADMLATAVQDLWDYHKERSQQQNDSGASAEEMQSVEALSLAIAQIQVIQIYLQDSTIPLPKAAATEGSFSTEGSVKQFSPTASEHKSTEPFVAEAPQSMLPSANAPSSPLLSKIGSHSARPSSLEASLSTQVPSRPYSHARPQLASSSFSWILGEDSIRTNFATDMAHSTLSSDGRRRSRGKGFLFGDDEDDFGIVAGHDRRSLSSTSGRRGVKSTRMKHTSGEESLEDMIVLNRMTKEGAE